MRCRTDFLKLLLQNLYSKSPVFFFHLEIVSVVIYCKTITFSWMSHTMNSTVNENITTINNMAANFEIQEIKCPRNVVFFFKKTTQFHGHENKINKWYLSYNIQFSSDAKLLEESTALTCKNLAINNCKTGNFGALVRTFLVRCTELKASAQCEE